MNENVQLWLFFLDEAYNLLKDPYIHTLVIILVKETEQEHSAYNNRCVSIKTNHILLVRPQL